MIDSLLAYFINQCLQSRSLLENQVLSIMLYSKNFRVLLCSKFSLSLSQSFFYCMPTIRAVVYFIRCIRNVDKITPWQIKSFFELWWCGDGFCNWICNGRRGICLAKVISSRHKCHKCARREREREFSPGLRHIIELQAQIIDTLNYFEMNLNQILITWKSLVTLFNLNLPSLPKFSKSALCKIFFNLD